MDRDALLARVRRQSLATTSELSDAEIYEDLEQGILDVAAAYKWPFLYAEDTITLADGTATYDLPADLMYLEELVHDGEGSGATLVRTSEAQVKAFYGDNVGDSDLPHLYYVTTDLRIRFVPTPDAVKTVNVTYYRTPDLANEFAAGTDTPPWHESFHRILVDAALAYFWEREEDLESSARFESRFYQGVERMAQFYELRLPSQSIIVGGGLQRRRRAPYAGWPEV